MLLELTIALAAVLGVFNPYRGHRARRERAQNVAGSETHVHHSYEPRRVHTSSKTDALSHTDVLDHLTPDDLSMSLNDDLPAVGVPYTAPALPALHTTSLQEELQASPRVPSLGCSSARYSTFNLSINGSGVA